MRLGQLARKLEVRPNQIVEFLATQNIDIDNGTNTRMEPDHVTIAAQHFSPGLPFEEVRDDVPDANEVAPENGHEAIGEPTAESQPANVIDEPPLENPEVIKAPKIELSGLK